MNDQATSPGVAKAYLSQAVLQLAKVLERLPPGDFIVAVTKPSQKGLPWTFVLQRVERIRVIQSSNEDQA